MPSNRASGMRVGSTLGLEYSPQPVGPYPQGDPSLYPTIAPSYSLPDTNVQLLPPTRFHLDREMLPEWIKGRSLAEIIDGMRSVSYASYQEGPTTKAVRLSYEKENEGIPVGIFLVSGTYKKGGTQAISALFVIQTGNILDIHAGTSLDEGADATFSGSKLLRARVHPSGSMEVLETAPEVTYYATLQNLAQHVKPNLERCLLELFTEPTLPYDHPFAYLVNDYTTQPVEAVSPRRGLA